MEKTIVAVDAAVVVKLSNQNMAASVTLVPPEHGGADITAGQIRDALAEHGVVYGLDEARIDRAGELLEYNQEIPVCRGTPPRAGENATLEFLFDTQVDSRPAELEDGSVDFHNMGIIQQVEAGQALCKKTPPTKGVDGVNVLNRPVPARPGRDLPLPKGRNTVVSEDGLTLLAAKAGHVEYIGRRVHVHSVYTIDGNVGPATGDIHFDGSVVVTGDMLPDYTVEATGDVTVWGTCESASIKAGGNVDVGGGIIRSTVEAAGNIRGKYLQLCNLYADNNIYTESAINSDIRCGGSLIVTGRKGTIVGGSVAAGVGVESAFIGAKLSSVPTYVEVGLPPAVQKRLREIPQEIDQAAKTLSNLDKAIILLSQLSRAGLLDAQKAQKLRAASSTREAEYNRYLDLLSEKEELDKQADMATAGKVISRGKISAGVHIVIGHHQMVVSSDLQRPKITPARDGLRIGYAS